MLPIGDTGQANESTGFPESARGNPAASLRCPAASHSMTSSARASSDDGWKHVDRHERREEKQQ
jgi:hypothetical protein